MCIRDSFITCHDGFTLNDLVSYAEKHNLANGEQGRDGANDNHSWNWGHEGPTDDPAILALRRRLMRNAVAMLMVSQGVPMPVSYTHLDVYKRQGAGSAFRCRR